MTSAFACASTLSRSAEPAALDDSALTESKKLDHGALMPVAFSENSWSSREDSVDSCCSRASSPPLSSRREVASESAIRRTSTICTPLPW